MNANRRLFYCLLISACISACGSTPPKESTSTLNQASDNQIQKILLNAENASGNSQNQLQLAAAELALKNEEWPLLRNIIDKINHSYLNSNEILRLAIIKSTLNLHDGNNTLALSSLQDSTVYNASFSASRNYQSIYLEKFASLQASQGNIETALSTLFRRADLLDGDLALINQQRIWSLLLIARDQTLQTLATSQESIKAGWGQLAQIYRDNSIDITDQISQLNQWSSTWQEHPANKSLPDTVKSLLGAANNLPEHVLIALPLSGNLDFAGKAIRDGILYAYWDQIHQGYTTPNISFIDSSKFNAQELLIQIQTFNADLVIGPFEKEKVQFLADHAAEIPHTILMNTITNPILSDNIISFGLNPEHEASQIAERALFEGGKKALVISPNNNLGDRLQTAFIDQWILLGGTISQIGRYEDNGNIPSTIKNALNIDKSELRNRRLKLNTGLSTVFEPRRRQDIDIAAVFAKPQDARSATPLFDFYYAQDIPIYMTSLSYTGEQNPIADKDLQDVIFNDIPWLFDPKSSAIEETGYKRLFALGIDAYRLQRRFNLLSPDNQIEISGATGMLSLNKNREIVRRLSWAKFIDGAPKPISAVSGNLSNNEQINR